ncbi:MAG: hypothetical protein NT062_19365 [Proteobacteria bacterium]|nr:hypothetical protein [Pseudomonadota bacterium]
MRIIVVLAVAACSSSKGASLEATRPLAKLTPAESDQLCQDLKSWTAAHHDADAQYRAECAFGALAPPEDASTPPSDEAAQARCHATKARCLATPMKTETKPPKPLDCAKFPKEIARCGDLTVGDLEGCVHEQVEIYQELGKTDLCTNATKAYGSGQLLSLLEKLTTGPKCKVMQAKCSQGGKAEAEAKPAADPAATAAAAAAAIEAGRAVAVAQEAVTVIERDLHEVDVKIEAAVSNVVAATSDADQAVANAKLETLRESKAELETRLAAAKADAARAERMRGVKISKECLDNPLAKGC